MTPVTQTFALASLFFLFGAVAGAFATELRHALHKRARRHRRRAWSAYFPDDKGQALHA